jgi:hypothetical protein
VRSAASRFATGRCGQQYRRYRYYVSAALITDARGNSLVFGYWRRLPRHLELPALAVHPGLNVRIVSVRIRLPKGPSLVDGIGRYRFLCGSSRST